MDSLSAPEPHGISTQGGSHSCRAHSCTCACVYTYSFTKIRCALPCPNYFCVPRLQAYMRRAAAHKELDDLDHALGDAKKVCVHKKGTHVFSTLGPVICLPTAKQSLSHPCRIAEAHRESHRGTLQCSGIPHSRHGEVVFDPLWLSFATCVLHFTFQFRPQSLTLLPHMSCWRLSHLSCMARYWNLSKAMPGPPKQSWSWNLLSVRKMTN